MLNTILQQYKRVKRQLVQLNYATKRKIIGACIHVSGDNNHLFIGDDEFFSSTKSDGSNAISTSCEDENQLLDESSEFVNNIQLHWTSFIPLICIVLVTSLLLIYLIRRYSYKKQRLLSINEQQQQQTSLINKQMVSLLPAHARKIEEV